MRMLVDRGRIRTWNLPTGTQQYQSFDPLLNKCGGRDFSSGHEQDAIFISMRLDFVV